MKPICIERRRATHFPALKRKRWKVDMEKLLISIKYIALTALGVILFHAGQAQALCERGYQAIGGEVFALFLPVFYYLISRTVRDTVNDMQREKAKKRKEAQKGGHGNRFWTHSVHSR